MRFVAFEPHASLQHAADAVATPGGSAKARLLLQRKNSVTMYGKLFDEQCYGASTPRYASLQLFDDAASASSAAGSGGGASVWDATLVERPLSDATLEPGTPCFLAMNRFPVRAECALLFEERWATRTTMLTRQPGLIGFSLLRRRGGGATGGATEVEAGVGEEAEAGEEAGDGEEAYTYSTATLWASQTAWSAWR